MGGGIYEFCCAKYSKQQVFVFRRRLNTLWLYQPNQVLCWFCQIGSDYWKITHFMYRYLPRLWLRSDMSGTKPLSCNHCSANSRECRGGCRCNTEKPHVSLLYVEYCDLRALSLLPSFGFSGIIFTVLLLLSVCSIPCDGGRNCANYNISCRHGSCVEDKLPSPGVNRTAKVVCSCDDRWSGPACDVFNCSGRTLWEPIITVLSFCVFQILSGWSAAWGEAPKCEAEGRDRGWGFWGGSSKPSPPAMESGLHCKFPHRVWDWAIMQWFIVSS